MAAIEDDPLHIQSESTLTRNSRDKKKSHDAMSLTDLPSSLLVDILARLPLRTLFVARSVCKAFVFLTTHNPHFINLHSLYADQILIFQFGAFDSPSSLLRMADLELYSKNYQLKPFFRLPKMEPDYKNCILSAPVFPFSKSGTACFGDLNRLFLVNTCNGLLFFHQNGDAGEYGSVVCNPVTSEYIVIPDVDAEMKLLVSLTKGAWLGFSPGSDQYKVLRIFNWKNADPDEVAAKVFVFGSDSWRDIDDTPQCGGDFSWDSCESQLVNGLMYWYDFSWPDSVISFDFEKEVFGEVDLPVEFQDVLYMSNRDTSLGVLRGCLCLSCNNDDVSRVDLWVMRKCGSQDSWRKEFVIDTAVGLGGGRVRGCFMPLQFLGNGEILMLWNGNALVCYDPGTETLRYIMLLTFERSLKVVALTPSFVPLKEALKVDEVLSQLRPRGDEKELMTMRTNRRGGSTS